MDLENSVMIIMLTCPCNITQLLYSEIGVYRSIHYFLILALKYKLLVLVRMALLMQLSILTPRGGGVRELNNMEKSLTNSPNVGKNFVSKIPWMGHQICYII